MEGLIIFRTNSCDFGNSSANLALRCAQDKYIASNCTSELARLAAAHLFADNYLFSARTKKMLIETIEELIKLHN